MSTDPPDSIRAFDEERADNYDDRIRRIAPGYELLHAAVGSLCSARLPDDASVLVAGAGTGEELVQLAEVGGDWRFTAVEPSAPMRERCRERVRSADLGERVDLVGTTVQEFDGEGSFDAATSIFVAHFLDDPDERHAYFSSLAGALRPGGLLIAADLFAAGDETTFSELMEAWRRHAVRSGIPEEDAADAFDNVRREITFADEPDLWNLLERAGFSNMTRFFQCFVWGAWTATRS